MIGEIVRKDVPGLSACSGVLTFCSLANIASVAQQVGMIFGAIGTIVIVAHRLYLIYKGKAT